jgi:hypothetical protein
LGAVRESNHFPILLVYVLVHGYRLIFRGGFQLINHHFNLFTFNYLETFNLLGLNLILLILSIYLLLIYWIRWHNSEFIYFESLIVDLGQVSI